MITISLGLLCLVLGGPGYGDPLPPFTADYRVMRNDLTIGTSRVTLAQHKDGSFEYESLTGAAGVLAWIFQKDRIREHSQWVMHNDMVRPLEYRYENTGEGERRTEQLIFDWNTFNVRQTARDPTWQMQVPEGTLDKVTMNLALMIDLQGQKKDFSYAIADDAKLRRYQFEIVDRQSIFVPAGRFETVKIKRTREKKSQSTFIWCAPALHYLPVQIDNRKDDGTVYRSVLTKVSGDLLASSAAAKK